MSGLYLILSGKIEWMNIGGAVDFVGINIEIKTILNATTLPLFDRLANENKLDDGKENLIAEAPLFFYLPTSAIYAFVNDNISRKAKLSVSRGSYAENSMSF